MGRDEEQDIVALGSIEAIRLLSYFVVSTDIPAAHVEFSATSKRRVALSTARPMYVRLL